MVVLKDYHEFGSVHWELGSIRNALAYQGMRVPQTNQPVSEALILGISGGVTVGYFSFAYKGFDPHVALLTHNTFDPMAAVFERLGILQNLRQTTSADKGLFNLIDALENGRVPLVWVDVYSLPYNAIGNDDQMWYMAPIIVYGYEEDRVLYTGRAQVPLSMSTEELAAARSRTKDNKHRLMTLELPDPDKLPSAIKKGIHACIRLFTETPPKGAKHNFGFAALQHWSQLLTSDRDKASWAKVFPPGHAMYAGLVSTFRSIQLFETAEGASRAMYADFLDEAAAIVSLDGLHEAAAQFRESGQKWQALAQSLLPDEVAPFAEARRLMLLKHQLFMTRGNDALAEMKSINAQLADVKATVRANFPLSAAQVTALKNNLSHQILEICRVEQAAISVLERAIN